jgi:hypothetical protein
MNDHDGITSRLVVPADVETDLAMPRQVLELRGWREDPNTPWCWRWPATPPLDGIALSAPAR